MARFLSGRFFSHGYTLLPVSQSSTSASPEPSRWPVWKKYILATAGSFFVLFLIFFDPYHGLPTYKAAKEAERLHDLEYGQGSAARYVKFPSTYKHVGFNNEFQDILILAHIAQASNRTYVHQPYIWSSWYKFLGPAIYYRGSWRSSAIPLEAFIEPPLPHSVSYNYFDSVCPWWRARKYVSIKEMRRKYNIEEQDSLETKRIIDAYVKELSELEDRCVVVDDKSDHVISYEALGRRVLSSFDTLRDSPVLQHFQWSTFIRTIFVRNRPLITLPSFLPTNTSNYHLPGLMALHVRRGDFEEHCPNLAEWRAVYYGWNMFPQYRDQFGNPWEFGSDEERVARYMQHCLPTVDQIIKRVEQVKLDWESLHPRHNLTQIYIMSNAERDFGDRLKNDLYAQGWSRVVISKDRVVLHDEAEIDLATDMMIGQNAEVFLGNGFSSLTSNVNLLRMAHGAAPESIRFW